MERRGTFDYIILETSGLADPGNLAPLFWVDEGLGSSIYLDGIVCLVDAKNILLSLDEQPPLPQEGDSSHGRHETTAHLQISHADVVVINKCDTVPPAHLSSVEQRIRSINGLTKIHKTSYSQIPRLETFLLDLHAYDGIQSLDLQSEAGQHSHLDPVGLPTLPTTPLPSLHSLTRSFPNRQFQHSPSPSPPSPPPL